MIMKKYTLQFKEQHLENRYQEASAAAKYNVFLTLTVLTIIFFIIYIIEQIILKGTMVALYLGVFTLIYAVGSLLLVRNRKQWAQISLYFLSHIFMLFQVNIKQTSEPQTAFLLASEIMSLHCVIMFIMEFRLAIITNTSLSLFRVIYSSMNSDLTFRAYLFVLMSYVVMNVGIYWKNRNSRVQYLLTLKDTQWKYILPKLVDNVFYTFTLNRSKLKFEMKVGSENATNQECIEFIRECKMENQTLEQFIFHRCKQPNTSSIEINSEQKLKVLYKGKLMVVKFFEFYVTELNFMVVIDNQILQQVKDRCKKINKQQLSIFNQFIGKLQELGKSINSKSYDQQNRQMLLMTFQFQCRLWLAAGQVRVSTIHLSALLRKCRQMLPDLSVYLTLDSGLTITTIKPLFLQLLIELFNSLADRQIELAIHQTEDVIIMQLIGSINTYQLQQSNLYNQALHLLQITTEYHQYGTYIYLCVGIILTIPCKLDLSYQIVGQEIVI